MSEYKNILVFGEVNDGKLLSITIQLMSIGKKLAEDLNQELHLLLLGGEITSASNEGFHYGADKVFEVTDPLLENYMTDSYLQAMSQIVKEQKPCIVLFGQNEKGMDLAPRLAFSINTGVTLDCIDLEIDPKSKLMKQVKPVYGGKANCIYFCEERMPQIVSVRDRAFDPAYYDDSRIGEVTRLSVSLDSSKIRTGFLEKKKDESLSLALKMESSKIVVSGGRGLKKKEGFQLLEETAELLDGAIAGSRVPVDNGWLPSSLQVGLTGKKIGPDVYFAVGISGAIQHIVGCLNAKTIVAINIDEDAHIFRVSNYGVVGDYREVLTAFNNEYRSMKEKQ